MTEVVSNLLGGFELDAITILNDAVVGVSVVVDGETVVLDGVDAEKFVRQRDITVAQSALDRSERQKEYIESFASAAKKQIASDTKLLQGDMITLEGEGVETVFFDEKPRINQ